MFAFVGIESALVPSGEVKDVARTIPCAVFLAMAVVTTLYVALQLVAQGVLGAESVSETRGQSIRMTASGPGRRAARPDLVPGASARCARAVSVAPNPRGAQIPPPRGAPSGERGGLTGILTPPQPRGLLSCSHSPTVAKGLDKPRACH